MLGLESRFRLEPKGSVLEGVIKISQQPFQLVPQFDRSCLLCVLFPILSPFLSFPFINLLFDDII